MLALGTSGVVYPASSFTFLHVEVKKNGATIIVINPTENAFPSITDVYEAFPAIVT